MFGLFTFGSVHLSSHVIKSMELFKRRYCISRARRNLIPTLRFEYILDVVLFAYFGFQMMCVFDQTVAAATAAASVSMESNKLVFTGKLLPVAF